MAQAKMKTEAETTVEALFECLDDERVLARIDVPIEQASRGILPAQDTTITIPCFNNTIACLVGKIYNYGLPIPHNMSYSEACAEAISILRHSYPSEHPDGYEAAYLDALDPEVGLGVVIDRMIDAIRSRQHEKYIDWVFFHHIRSRDWSTRCQIFSLLRERWREFLPGVFLEGSTGVYANNLKEFILHFRGIEDEILREARRNGEI